MSSSRPGGSSVIWLARSSSSSVRVAHGGDDDDDVVAVLLRADDPLGDTLHVLCGRDGGTAVLLDDEGHGSTGYRASAARTGGCVPDAARDVITAMDASRGAGCSAPTSGATRTPRCRPGPRATSSSRWCTAAAYFDRLVDEVRVAERRRPPVLHRLARRSRRAAARRTARRWPSCSPTRCKRGVCVRGLVWRSHMARMSLNKEANRALDTRDRARRRRGDPRPAGAPDGQPPPEVRRPAARRGPVPGRRLRRAASTCATAAATTPTTGATRSRCRWPRPTGRHPPWHDVQLQIRGPAVGVLDTVFRERWEDPNSPDAGPPDRLDPRQAAPHPAARRPAAAAAAAAPGVRAAPRADPAHLPGDPAAVRLRAGRRAVGGPRLHEGDQAGAAADLPRGPVHVVGRRRPAVRRGADRAPATCTWSSSCRACPTRTAPFAERPQMVGRWQAIEMCRKAGEDRVHVFDVENHAGTPVYVHAKVCVVDDVWASVGSDNFNRRSWTHDSELSSAVLDTTRDPREPARPGRHRRRRAHLRPRPAADAGPRAPGPGRRRQRGRRRCSTPSASSTIARRARPPPSTRGTRAAGSGPRPPGPAPSAPRRASCRCSPGSGRRRSTACSTTPTAAPCACA